MLHVSHCCECEKVLAKVDGVRIYIRQGLRIRITAGLPATAVCPRCGALNEIR